MVEKVPVMGDGTRPKASTLTSMAASESSVRNADFQSFSAPFGKASSSRMLTTGYGMAGLGALFVTGWQSRAQIAHRYSSLAHAVLAGHRSQGVLRRHRRLSTTDYVANVVGLVHIPTAAGRPTRRAAAKPSRSPTSARTSSHPVSNDASRLA